MDHSVQFADIAFAVIFSLEIKIQEKGRGRAAAREGKGVEKITAKPNMNIGGGGRAMIVWKDMSGFCQWFFSRLLSLSSFVLASFFTLQIHLEEKDVKVVTFEGIPSFVLSVDNLKCFSMRSMAEKEVKEMRE